MKPQRAFILIGTRPEAIKLAPVIISMQQSTQLRPVVCSTGQHKEMLDAVLDDFGIRPDLELAVMQHGQSLSGLAGRLFLSLEKKLHGERPNCILVQGDTTSAFVGAVCGFYERIPVGHIEAGLRSGNMYAPFPEEFNRKATALAATWHFAPTTGAAHHLEQEGVDTAKIFVTGNTVVDALHLMRDSIRTAPPALPAPVESILAQGRPYVLITGHRRENFGQGMKDMCTAIAYLAQRHPEYAFVYPVHLNPQVHTVVKTRLSGLSNIILTAPCPYRPFLRLLDNCSFILSDSGGIQEEAPSFGKQVLVMRDNTERPEGVAAGFCHLVGTNPANIVSGAETLFTREQTVAQKENPYGDGKAAGRIVKKLESLLRT